MRKSSFIAFACALALGACVDRVPTVASPPSVSLPIGVEPLVARTLDLTQPYWSGYLTYSSDGTVWTGSSVLDPVTTQVTTTYPVETPATTVYLSIGFGSNGTPAVVLSDADGLESDAPLAEQFTTVVL